MRNIFDKMFEHHFFLPNEFSFKNDLNTKDIERILKENDFIFDKIKSQKVGDFLYFVSIFCWEEEKILFFKKRIARFKEFVPPWIAFPDLFQGSPRWNQGFEEQYANIWKDFFTNMTISEREIYLTKHNCPDQWLQWFKEVNYFAK